MWSLSERALGNPKGLSPTGDLFCKVCFIVKIKNMFEEIPTIEKEKTREELLKEFESSLGRYGAEGASVEMEDNNLKIEQKCGEGIRGVGYDGKLWMCLDQEGESDRSCSERISV